MDVISLSELCKAVELSFTEKTYEAKLYQGARKGIFRNDRQAVASLYQDRKFAKEYYRQVKSKLKKRLLDTFYASEIAHANEFQKGYHEAHKIFCIAEELIGRNMRRPGIILMKEALSLAESHGVNSVASFAARALVSHYGAMEADKAQFRKFKEKYRQLSEKNRAEDKLRLAYADVAGCFRNRWAGGREVNDMAQRYLAEVDPSIALNDVKLSQLFFKVKILGYQAASLWEKVLETCEEAVSHLKQLPGKKPYSVFFTFEIGAISACLQLLRYQDADAAISRLVAKVPKGHLNWSLLMLYSFISKLNQLQYEEARKVYASVASYLEKMPPAMAENWRIAWAYYAFLADAPVQVGKFMNEVPIYSKDKEGSNCAILIAQLIHYLKEGKRGFVIDRMDGLNRYKRRYLSGDLRTAAFVGLLSCLPKAGFNRQKAEKLAGPQLEKLQAEKSISDIELVRYELLWEKVLELLD